MAKGMVEELRGTTNEIIQRVKTLIKEGNARRLLIKNSKGKTLAEFPLTAGVAGTATLISMAPIISAISMFILFVNDVNVIVEKYVDENHDPNEVEAEYIEIKDEENADGETS